MLRKLGSYGAFLQGLAYITMFILYMAIYPAEGWTEEMMSDMNLMYNFAFGHVPLLKLQYLLDVAFGVGIMTTVLAMYRRFRGRNIDAALLILGSGFAGSILFLASGVMGIVNIDQTVQLANGQVTQSFISLGLVQGGLEVAGIFSAGWAMLFIAYASSQAKVMKNWMNILGYIGAAGSILMMPLFIIAPSMMFISMMLGLFGMVYMFAMGFSLSGKAAQQAFELDTASSR